MRLIDADKIKYREYRGGGGRDYPENIVNEDEIAKMPTVDAIPIAVIKRAIAGINAADQCDQAGRYDFQLRNALKTVLSWYDTPLYRETERRTNG